MLNQYQSNAYRQRLGYRNWLRMAVIGFCVLTTGILFLGAILAHGDIDLADEPMFTKINPPPFNLMVLLDDSGSMTYEILVRGRYDGQFPNPDYSSTQGFCYVFDNMGDGYNLTDSYRQMKEADRRFWRSQWHVTNAMYYNPRVVYEPWPGYGTTIFPNANKDTPRVHPLQTKVLD
jgi:hypothetical protein